LGARGGGRSLKKKGARILGNVKQFKKKKRRLGSVKGGVGGGERELKGNESLLGGKKKSKAKNLMGDWGKKKGA